MKLHNIPLAVLSLVISLGLWIFVGFQPPEIQRRVEVDATEPGTVSVDVELRNIPRGFIPQDKPPRVVLRASGSQDEISRLSEVITQNPKLLEVWVDLSKARYGIQPYPLQIQSPKGFEDVRWTAPKEVKVPLDQNGSREFKVEVEPIGVPMEGFGLGSKMETDPKTVTVSGLQSKLDKIDKAGVLLDLSSFRGAAMNGTVRFYSSVGAELPIADDLKISPPQVIVLASLVPKPSAQKLVIQPSITGQPAPGFKILRIDVEPNQVVIRGPSASLSRVFTVTTKAVDISGLTQNRVFRTRLALPEDLREAEPKTIIVKITIVQEGITGPSPSPSTSATAPPTP